MFAQRKNHCRAVSSSAVGLNSLNVAPASARVGQPWVSTVHDAAQSRRPVRCFSAESLHVIPQAKDIESQFQAVLGKCLFEKAVQIAEEEDEPASGRRAPPARPGSSESLSSSRAGSSYGSLGCNSPMIPDGRTLTLRPTRCTSPLVKGSRSFDSYINRGAIDTIAVAKTRGAIESPKPSIHRYLRRMRTVSDQELNGFSLKAEFTDKGPESDREQYWRRKKEEKIMEEELRERKRQEKAEMLVILDEMKKEYDKRKAREEEAERLRVRLEEERIAKEKEKELALLESIENQSNLDDASSVVSSSSKSSKKRSSKKGRGSKKDKNSKKGKSASSRKSAKRKSAVAPSRPDDEEGQRSGRNTPQPILKPSDERRPSDGGSGDTSQAKKVTFREKLVSTRTIRSHKPVSSRKGSQPKKAFPGSSSSESRSASPTPGDKRKKSGSSKGKRGGSGKGAKKGTTKKASVQPAPPVEPPKEPEPPAPKEPEPAPEPAVEPVPEVPEPAVVVADEPPEFCPAGEYKTRKQMVEEWLYYRSCSAYSRVNPPVL